jgi:hypothetical protein
VRHGEGLGTFYRALEGAEPPGCEGEWWGAAMASAVSALKGEQRGWARHRFERRRAGDAVNSASMVTEESAGGIRAAATPAECGGGGCSGALEEGDGASGSQGQ